MKKLILVLTLALLPGCQTVNLSCLTTTGDGAKTTATMRDTDSQPTSTSLQGNLPMYGGTVTQPANGR